ncbi:MAG: hypothetical protein PHQ43_09530 [Dehalococcoidales bacterium]|nr:hypothetical protein [Dehalococcoidales bacterium]
MFDMNTMLRTYGIDSETFTKMQAITSRIKAEVSTDNNEVKVRLETSDPEANELMLQVKEAVIKSVAQCLYQFFGIQGKRL